MQFCLCFETIFFVIGSFLVLAHGFLSLRKYAQKTGWVGAVKGLCSTVSQTILRWARSCVELVHCNCFKDLTPGDELLKRKLAQRQLEAMTIAITTIGSVLSLAVAFKNSHED
eukprot:TRINITY_DN43060_c0_g1_i1.p1 TRINITY_DN43060_c0_g1~~TRINITY_DN43060_c0_g1_i1.p1  ORF type:complete len:113 (-),score=15.07 TRINITY_DN43060_c0_g1_i1:58-396(-)